MMCGLVVADAAVRLAVKTGTRIVMRSRYSEDAAKAAIETSSFMEDE